MGSSLVLSFFVALLCLGTFVQGQSTLTPEELQRLKEAKARGSEGSGSSGSSSSGSSSGSRTFTAGTLGEQGSSGTSGSSGSSSGLLSSGSSSSSSGKSTYSGLLGGGGDKSASNGLLTGLNTGTQLGSTGNTESTATTGNTLNGSPKKCNNKYLSGNNCVTGESDPIMSGFTGRKFNFMGDAGKIYSLISSKNHQMSTKLKAARMWDHNGTTMEGIAVMYKTYKVLMELEGDHPKVYVQEKVLPEKTRAQKHTWRFDDGTSVEMEWDRFKPGLGNSITVTTEMMKVYIWHTPKGIIDEGGVMLDGYLNFNITLLAPPENNVMSGVIGDTYERFTVGQEAYSPNSTYWMPEDQVWYGKAPKQAYEMAGYWDTGFKMNTFGLDAEEVRSRSSLELDSVQLVDLPASASFSVLPDEQQQQQQATLSAAAATAVLRLRRMLGA